MSEPVTILIPGRPVPKGRPRFNAKQKRTYTPAKTSAYENLVGLKANQAMAGRPAIDGPLHMDLRAHYEIPKSWSKDAKTKALLGEIAPRGADVDNICKSVCDACNKIVYGDDSQITSIRATKVYAHEAFVVATFKPAYQGSHRVPEIQSEPSQCQKQG